MSEDTPKRRVTIRLKHSLAADEEINLVLPDTLDEFEKKIARGEMTDIRTNPSTEGGAGDNLQA